MSIIHSHRSKFPHRPPSTAPAPFDDGAPRSWSVLVIALVAQALVVLDISVVNTALPTIGRSLQLGSHDLQWLVTAYLLFSGGGLLLGGRLADLFSRRRLFLAGLALFTSASLLAGFSDGSGTLVAARATQGLAAAVMTPAALSLIMTAYVGAQRARGLALWGAVGSLGVAAGVLFGGALTTWAGWQTIFWINVPFGLGAFIAAIIVLPKHVKARPGWRSVDLPGGVVLVAGIGSLLLGIQGASEFGWTSMRTLALLFASAVLLYAFRAIERRAAAPLVPPHTWKIKTLVTGTTVMLGTTGILVGVIFVTSIFVQTVLGYSALQTGLAFLPLALMMAVAAHAASHLTQVLPARTIAAIGMGLSLVGALLLSRASSGASFLGDLLPGLLIFGFGIGLVFVSVSITAMIGIPAEHAGVASGFLMTGHEVGAALGVAVISAVSATAGSLTSVAGAADGFVRGLVAAAALSALVAVIAHGSMPATRRHGGAPIRMHH